MIGGGFKQCLVGHQLDGIEIIDVDGAKTTLLGTPQQIRFDETIIDQLTAHGVMEPSALYEPPFTRIDSGGPDALFDGRENVVAGIFETLDAINSGLYDEGTSLRVARGKSGGTMHCESV